MTNHINNCNVLYVNHMVKLCFSTYYNYNIQPNGGSYKYIDFFIDFLFNKKKIN